MTGFQIIVVKNTNHIARIYYGKIIKLYDYLFLFLLYCNKIVNWYAIQKFRGHQLIQ
mgnify:CR=1 FL=1